VIIILSVFLVCVTVVAVTWMMTQRKMVTEKPRSTVLDERLLDYVVVSLKSGTTFGGVLYVEDDGAVILAKAEQYNPDRTRTPADGEIILLRSDIDYIQRP
jgi:small nuclear ribonucleoprotein (snRNP)-like protein